MKKLEADILKILEDDCRYTPAKIAVMLGRTEEEIEGAVRSMEERGVIVKYTAIVNGERLSDETVQALIEVRVSPQKSSGFDAIAEEIYRFEEVKSCYLMLNVFLTCPVHTWPVYPLCHGQFNALSRTVKQIGKLHLRICKIILRLQIQRISLIRHSRRLQIGIISKYLAHHAIICHRQQRHNHYRKQ